MKSLSQGFTLVELIITVVIAAIALSMAVPSYNTFIEKRQLTAAAEDLASFVTLAQVSAIKMNRPVRVAWKGSSSHSDNFCIGISSAPKAMPCDCRVSDPSATNFCAIAASSASAGDGQAYRLSKADFVDINNEFLHMRPATGHFAFDPVRGVVANWSDTDIVDDDYLFYMHSNEGSGWSRLFALEVSLNMTGRMEICSQTSRRTTIGTYPPCL
jgi:prepilin-type N-terminal cleavage/methylation domain-containing protein